MHTVRGISGAALGGALIALLATGCSGGDGAEADASGPTVAESTTVPGEGSSPSTTGDAATPSTDAEMPTTTATPGTARPEGDGEGVDACGLLSLDEVEAFFGGPAAIDETGELAVELPGGVDQCVWSTPVDETATELTPQDLLQIGVYGGRQYYAEIVYPNAEELDLGEQAFVSTGDESIGVVVGFLQGDRYVQVNYNVLFAEERTAAASKDAAVALARTLADRLA